MKEDSLDPYGIGMKLGEISSNIVTIFKKLDAMEQKMKNLEDCHKSTREELLEMQGKQSGISEKNESILKKHSLKISIAALLLTVCKFLMDFFSSK
jgi:hypothetical protein